MAHDSESVCYERLRRGPLILGGPTATVICKQRKERAVRYANRAALDGAPAKRQSSSHSPHHAPAGASRKPATPRKRAQKRPRQGAGTPAEVQLGQMFNVSDHVAVPDGVHVSLVPSKLHVPAALRARVTPDRSVKVRFRAVSFGGYRMMVQRGVAVAALGFGMDALNNAELQDDLVAFLALHKNDRAGAALCGRRHRLKYERVASNAGYVAEGWWCDVCSVRYAPGGTTERYTCAECKYDVCMACAAGNGVKRPKPAGASSKPAKPRKNAAVSIKQDRAAGQAIGTLFTMTPAGGEFHVPHVQYIATQRMRASIIDKYNIQTNKSVILTRTDSRATEIEVHFEDDPDRKKYITLGNVGIEFDNWDEELARFVSGAKDG